MTSFSRSGQFPASKIEPRKQPILSALFGAIVLSFAALPVQSVGQVVLNEVLADNRSAVLHSGNFPDYIELRNLGAAPVNLTGWSLTDDPLVPQKFVFPVGATIPANGYLIVWADLNFAAPGLHTGFGLGAKGDLVRLFNNIGVLQDEIVFGLQVGDVSLGRVPDGTGAWTVNQPSAGFANTAIPLGNPTNLWINEWMARPATGDDWLEVFNSDDEVVALGGLVITDTPVGVPGNRAIPNHSYIGARGFVQFFASDLAQPDADHLDFKLAAEGETLTIYAADRVTVLERLVYGAQAQNTSEGRAPDGSDNIMSFTGASISPGRSNFQELTEIVISEVLSHTDPPLEDAIELQNLTGAPVDISHWWLSDSASNPRKYRIPPGTIIPAYGFKVFYQAQFGAGANGFALNSAEGDDVFLSVGDAGGNLTGKQTFVQFGALKNGVSIGRYVTSTGVDFVPLSQRTFGVDNPTTIGEFRMGTGLSNAAPQIGPVVINEIMYYPPDVAGQPNTDGEFLELHNPTANPVELFDPQYPTNTFRIRDGITFDFPQNIILPPNGYLLLVSFDPVASPGKLAEFRAAYAVPESVPVLGPYSGKLSDSGESIELLTPDVPEGPTSSIPGFVPYMLLERIRYSPSAPWPTTTAGTSQSLQRITSLAYGNEPLNWFGGTPTAGRANVVDSDGDGMPDAWENEYELNPNSAADADDDADNDGATNLQEFLAGTNPRQAASVFAFTRVTKESNGVRLHFHGVAGRTYSLQSRDFSSPGTWQTVTNLPAMESTGEQSLLLPESSGSGQFFRLITPATP